MTKKELITQITELNDDDDVSTYLSTVVEEPKKEIKADSIVTMTASEFIQIFDKFTNIKNKEKEKQDNVKSFGVE